MAITGIDTIDGKQIIAAGAVSAKSAEMAYNDENGNPITGYQAAGDYYSASNPSGFITGVDLTPYQLTADMTAYQPVGDYLTTADSANFYTTANESGFISEVPDTYLQNTDLSTEDGKVTAISGIPLSAGGDVPEGVMVESGLEYNAVNEISGYNGSAIAQYGAEKQWLQHDDTIVHVSNSAQYAFGCNVSALQRLMGVDETVLYSGNATTTDFPLTLNEPMSSFDTIKFYWQTFNYDGKNWTVSEKVPVGNNNYYTLFDGIYNTATKAWYDVAFAFKEENYKLNYVSGAFKNWTANNLSDASGFLRMFKVLGIGRKQ